MKIPAQEKEIVGNDRMNQEVFNPTSVPFPEPKVPETASFNFELQRNPEKVEVDTKSPLKTPAPEKVTGAAPPARPGSYGKYLLIQG